MAVMGNVRLKASTLVLLCSCCALEGALGRKGPNRVAPSSQLMCRQVQTGRRTPGQSAFRKPQALKLQEQVSPALELSLSLRRYCAG